MYLNTPNLDNKAIFQFNLQLNDIFVHCTSTWELFFNQSNSWCNGDNHEILIRIIYLFLKSSSSSCRTISMDIPGPFLPPFSIVHCFWQIFRVTSHISTELLYVGSSRSSCLCSSMWRGPQEYVTYEFVLTSPVVSLMSGSSNIDSFRDGCLVALQLLLCGVLPP